MDVSKVRGKNELRVTTKYPNEVESFLENLPNCVISEYAQVWNNQGTWMFWIRTKTDKLAASLRIFLKEVDWDYESTKSDE